MSTDASSTDYEFDVFISYRHAGAVYEWVHHHFYPRLREWLAASAPSDLAVFIDTDIEPGSVWSHTIRNALRRSKLMVAVFSPDYFRSSWCLAEFKTMIARQQACGIPHNDDARGLIVPVKFSDGNHFPDEARAIQYCDLSQWNMPYRVFADSVPYLDFAREVQSFAETLVRRLASVPTWRADWPIIDPQSLSSPSPPGSVLELPKL